MEANKYNQPFWVGALLFLKKKGKVYIIEQLVQL
jgi:hypothetical protein